MTFDKYFDCLDLSDELHFADKYGNMRQTFGSVPYIASYDDYRCGSARSFPCDDDRIVCTTTLWSSPSCDSQRDLRFIQTLLGPSNGNTNDFVGSMQCVN